MARNESSVAEALGQAHAALLEDLRRLENAARSTSPASMAEVRQRLEATRRHIGEHFRFEEQNGYMDAVRQREPRLEREIQQLAEEHRRLEHSLDALREASQTVSSPDAAFRQEIQHWIKQVRQHESRENDLVMDAFNMDISAED